MTRPGRAHSWACLSQGMSLIVRKLCDSAVQDVSYVVRADGVAAVEVWRRRLGPQQGQ